MMEHSSMNPHLVPAAQTSRSAGGVPLHARHRAGLVEERGIAWDIVQERGYLSLDDPEDVRGLGFNKAQARAAPVLAIPLWNVHGQQSGWQIRPDSPRQFKDGRVGKYEGPKGSHLQLDVHPRVQPLLANPQIPLWITEGIPKGDALVTHGACTIALIGVHGFKGSNAHGGKVILPDWGHVALNEREVIVVFDSDLYQKRDVDRALKALYTFLRSREAIPRLVQWPQEYRTKKWGVDDYLAQGHTLEDLLALVPPQGPLPPRPPRFASNGAVRPGEEPALPYSDYTNALAFVRDHGQDLRYCEAWKKWLIWTGTHWSAKAQGPVMQLAKATIKRLLRQGEHLDDEALAAWMHHIKRSLSTAALKAMVESAQNEPGVAVAYEALNQAHWLLPCLNGTLDLTTGLLRPHAREDLLTACLAIPYDATATCPRWEQFLWQIMGGSQSDDTPEMSVGQLEARQQADTRARLLVAFLQRVLGMCLTGAVREQDLYVFYGVGANGKSTLLGVLLRLLGQYAMKAAPELLMASKDYDRHPTERADLFGRRLVAAIETEQGRRLNETLVKELTGGDPVRARRMREDFWEFLPSHKIILATNHKPEIRGTDHAIWRRIKLIPFTVTIPDNEQDKEMPEKLLAELPGILAWMVKGCLAWQQHGLGTPDTVIDATSTYREEMDDVQRFLTEVCLLGQDYYQTSASALLKAYHQWSGQTTETAKALAQKLHERGFESKRGKTGMFWLKIGLFGGTNSRV